MKKGLQYKYMYYKVVITAISLIVFLFVSANSFVSAQSTDVLLYDTSNNYLGACGFTDTSNFTLANDLEVSLFQVWYKWNSGEGPLALTVIKDGTEFLAGNVERAACDPYQTTWCNGNLTVNKTFPVGSYVVKVANARQCADMSSNGVVRLYGAQTVSPTMVTPTIVPTIYNSPTPVPTTPLLVSTDENDSCSSNNWVYPILGLSGIGNIGLLIYIFKRK